MTYRLYSHYRQRRSTDKDIMGESQQVQVNMTASVGLHIIAVYASPQPEASGVRGKANRKRTLKMQETLLLKKGWLCWLLT